MRRVVVSEYVSLDGVVEAPGPVGEFEHAGWTRPYWNDEMAQFKFDELFASDALLLGRRTYQEFAAAWPSRTDESGFADRMNSIPKYVVTTTLEEAAWSNSRLIDENVVDEILELKQQPGLELLIVGSGELVNSLMPHELIDEFRFAVYPLVLGSGKRLFRAPAKTPLTLVQARTFSSGVALLTYEPNSSR